MPVGAYLSILASREPLEGGEALDLNVLKLVCRRVHLGNDNVGDALKLLTQAVPDGGQLLAVAAPRCVYSSSRSRMPGT